MELVYLFNNFDVLCQRDSGIYRKMSMQADAFVKLGYRVNVIIFDDMRVHHYDVEKNISSTKYFSIPKKAHNYVFSVLGGINPELIYVRFRVMDNHYVMDFYRELTSKYSKCILEVPTFPYDKELPDGSVMKKNDMFYREYLGECFDVTVSYGSMSNIYGIRTIGIRNGIDVSKILPKRVRKKDGIIKLVSVATMQFWHAFERVIEGLHNYYEDAGSICVELYLIGDGPEYSKYVELAEKYNLEKYVHFLGLINDASLIENIFDEMDIAIGTVGMYRIGLHEASPLKSGEYFARGIPYVIDFQEFCIDENYPYILKVSREESPVDINKIVDFYNRVNFEIARDDMREYAENELTWIKQLEKVLVNL